MTMRSRLLFVSCIAGFGAVGVMGSQALAASKAILYTSPASREGYTVQKFMTKDFLHKIHLINQAEINAGKVAEAKGQTAAVRNYGKMMVDDHTAADDKVLALAKKKGIDLERPGAIRTSRDTKRLSDNLTTTQTTLAATGANDFDHEYAQAMVNGHMEARAIVAAAARDLKDKDAKALAQELAPQLEEHERQARGLLNVGVAH